MKDFPGFARNTLLLETLSAIAQCQDPRNFWIVAMGRLKWILDFTRVDIALKNSDGSTYSLETIFELRPDVPMVFHAGLPISKGIVGKMMRSGEACRFFEPRVHPFERECIVDEGLEGGSLSSILSVSLKANNQQLGVLTFGDANERTYSHQDMEIASQFATHAAIFIQNWQQLVKLKENTTLLDLAAEKLKNSHATLESLVARRTAALRALSIQLLKTQDEERRRVARDLHDSTGQTLIALKMNVANLQKQFVGDHATSDALAEIADIANQAIQEIRTTSYLLHPPLLDELGLASVARWYVDGFSKRSGIQVTLDLPSGSERLPNDIEMVLFRVLQESLTNVHRHSGATAVDIKLVKGTEAVYLQVHDNGRGMSRNLMDGSCDAKNRSGVGLAGMSERINDLDGRLEIESSSNGTNLRVNLPLGGAARPTDTIAFAKDRTPRVFAALHALPLIPLSNPIAERQARPARRGFSRGRRLAF